MIQEARRRSVQPARSTMMRGSATAVMKSSIPTSSAPRHSAASMTARARQRSSRRPDPSVMTAMMGQPEAWRMSGRT